MINSVLRKGYPTCNGSNVFFNSLNKHSIPSNGNYKVVRAADCEKMTARLDNELRNSVDNQMVVL
jgi:hypothetical protein